MLETDLFIAQYVIYEQYWSPEASGHRSPVIGSDRLVIETSELRE
jgi:hypothetical protein